MNTIDFVFPYVDCSDKVWKKTYIEERRKKNLPTTMEAMRYRDWDNLQYLFRGIAEFMPWIRNVYMIVSNIEQVPSWVNTKEVKIVLHKDFIPEEFLPTFNSTCIEMFLKDIPGLSDRFIYGNDDCFPIHPMKETDFFDNEKIVLFTKKDKGLNSQFKRVEYNTETLAASLLNKKITDDPNKSFIKIQHSINPIRKGTAEKILKKAYSEIYNSITPFRDEKNYNQYLYSYYEYFSENITNIDQKYNYYKINRGNLYKICNTIIEQSNNIICINDVDELNEDEVLECKELINEAFETILFKKCKYEKGHPGEIKKEKFTIKKEKKNLIFEIPFENDEDENYIINAVRVALNNRPRNCKGLNKKDGYKTTVADYISDIKVKKNNSEYYTKDEIMKLLDKYGCKCPR